MRTQIKVNKRLKIDETRKIDLRKQLKEGAQKRKHRDIEIA